MGKKAENLTGMIFGRLRVLERAENDKWGKPQWLCECSCKDKTKKVISASRLKSGNTQSCGCLARELSRDRAKRYNIYTEEVNYIVGKTLTNDYEFYIDKKHYDLIREYCWHQHQDGYLRTCVGHKENGGNIYKLMHVMIMEAEGHIFEKGEEVDHINGKPNDNRIENLRITTHCNNMKNEKLYVNNTSGYKGVYYSKREQKWKAHITSDNIVYHLGTFSSKEEAIAARQRAEEELHKEYSRAKEDLHNGTRQNDYEVAI